MQVLRLGLSGLANGRMSNGYTVVDVVSLYIVWGT